MSGRINGEHKEKDLEPWDGGETHASDSLESLSGHRRGRDERHTLHTHTHTHTDTHTLLTLSVFLQSNGWDPNDMFKYNEEQYGVKSTYDSSLSTYT